MSYKQFIAQKVPIEWHGSLKKVMNLIRNGEMIGEQLELITAVHKFVELIESNSTLPGAKDFGTLLSTVVGYKETDILSLDEVIQFMENLDTIDASCLGSSKYGHVRQEYLHIANDFESNSLDHVTGVKLDINTPSSILARFFNFACGHYEIVDKYRSKDYESQAKTLNILAEFANQLEAGTTTPRRNTQTQKNPANSFAGSWDFTVSLDLSPKTVETYLKNYGTTVAAKPGQLEDAKDSKQLAGIRLQASAISRACGVLPITNINNVDMRQLSSEARAKLPLINMY